jgi:hypothetical protein
VIVATIMHAIFLAPCLVLLQAPLQRFGVTHRGVALDLPTPSAFESLEAKHDQVPAFPAANDGSPERAVASCCRHDLCHSGRWHLICLWVLSWRYERLLERGS